ncbi:MAG TPA: zinc ribbon domain-containing protein [Solirubrobacteraceae bacterium]|nr:zinc ribbon domain-containing protein [Solirubrobacteraceae bacterium]
MRTGFDGNGRDGDTVPLSPPTAVRSGTPTESLVASAVGDRCANCGAMLSSDQRYCVVCGERRGAPRFTLPAATVTTTQTSVSPARPPRVPRSGSATTLVAGVGTLLLALLVGFVIGNAASRNNTKTVSASAPAIKVLNVGGAGPAAASRGTSAAGTPHSAAKSARRSHTGAAKAPAHKTIVTKKIVNAESNAAAKVLGGNHTPPATTKLGQKCSGSTCSKAGFNKKTHKFDGSFFGQ